MKTRRFAAVFFTVLAVFAAAVLAAVNLFGAVSAHAAGTPVGKLKFYSGDACISWTGSRPVIGAELVSVNCASAHTVQVVHIETTAFVFEWLLAGTGDSYGYSAGHWRIVEGHQELTSSRDYSQGSVRYFAVQAVNSTFFTNQSAAGKPLGVGRSASTANAVAEVSASYR